MSTNPNKSGWEKDVPHRWESDTKSDISRREGETYVPGMYCEFLPYGDLTDGIGQSTTQNGWNGEFFSDIKSDFKEI